VKREDKTLNSFLHFLPPKTWFFYIDFRNQLSHPYTEISEEEELKLEKPSEEESLGGKTSNLRRISPNERSKKSFHSSQDL